MILLITVRSTVWAGAGEASEAAAEIAARSMRMNEYRQQLQDGIDEMEATIERLREEIKDLTEQRDALKKNNLELYRKLIQPDF